MIQLSMNIAIELQVEVGLCATQLGQLRGVCLNEEGLISGFLPKHSSQGNLSMVMAN